MEREKVLQISKEIFDPGKPFLALIRPIEGEIEESGFYENLELGQWELWYVSEDKQEKINLGFSSFYLGVKQRELWKMDFYHRWTGLRSDIDGWEC